MPHIWKMFINIYSSVYCCLHTHAIVMQSLVFAASSLRCQYLLFCHVSRNSFGSWDFFNGVKKLLNFPLLLQIYATNTKRTHAYIHVCVLKRPFCASYLLLALLALVLFLLASFVLAGASRKQYFLFARYNYIPVEMRACANWIGTNRTCIYHCAIYNDAPLTHCSF